MNDRFSQNLIVLERILNLTVILGIIVILVVATFLQLYLHELPCPLCLLQRAGYLSIGMALLLNLHFEFRPSHYALALLGGLFTAFVALRQISLHVLPGTGVYGSSIFGFHLYTWSFISAMIIVTLTAILLGVDRQYFPSTPSHPMIKKITILSSTILLIITLSNVLGTYLECGLSACPDNPVEYKVLEEIAV